jgi:hypothetical protein
VVWNVHPFSPYSHPDLRSSKVMFT